MKVIYRDRRMMHYPNVDGTFQRETLKSVNEAKRRSREEQKRGHKVKVGTPPTEGAVRQVLEQFS